jgi:hypothetical protein
MDSKYFVKIIPFLFYYPRNCVEQLYVQVNIFTEEILRSGSAASLSLLLNRLDPVLRNIANLGR